VAEILASMFEEFVAAADSLGRTAAASRDT